MRFIPCADLNLLATAFSATRYWRIQTPLHDEVFLHILTKDKIFIRTESISEGSDTQLSQYFGIIPGSFAYEHISNSHEAKTLWVSPASLACVREANFDLDLDLRNRLSTGVAIYFESTLNVIQLAAQMSEV